MWHLLPDDVRLREDLLYTWKWGPGVFAFFSIFCHPLSIYYDSPNCEFINLTQINGRHRTANIYSFKDIFYDCTDICYSHCVDIILLCSERMMSTWLCTCRLNMHVETLEGTLVLVTATLICMIYFTFTSITISNTFATQFWTYIT